MWVHLNMGSFTGVKDGDPNGHSGSSESGHGVMGDVGRDGLLPDGDDGDDGNKLDNCV